MSKLIWDRDEDRTIETGADKGVVYPKTVDGQYGVGVAWNGLTAVNESPSGAEATPVWADNIKYLNLYSGEDYSYTIECVNYPVEFLPCDGVRVVAPGVFLPQQTRRAFGFCYQTKIANEDAGIDYGYKIHLCYNSKVTPTEKSHSTVNESPENETFSWEAATTPEVVTVIDPETGNPYKPTAHLEINANSLDPAKLAALERILYGSETTAPRLPLPDEVLTLLASA